MTIPWPAIPALVAELLLYLLLATPWPGRIPSNWLPPAIAAGAVLPALLFPTAWPHLGLVLLIATIPACWFAVLPRHRATDLLFVAVMAALWVSEVFDGIYGSKLDILGKSMWIRSGILAVLYVAREPGIGFGFWPTRDEWRIGLKYFLWFLPVGLGIAYALGYLKAPQPRPLQGLGMFAGTLWFIAVGEEFFFRGLLQRWIGLPAASLLFGLAHIGFRQFPNWKHVAVTIALGVFCGLAARQGRGIRAAMVSHALVNAIWVGVFGKF